MSKKTNGILLGLFFGVLGLIGLSSCTEQTQKDEFMSGWWIGIIIQVIGTILISVIYYVSTMNYLNNLYNYYNY